MPTTTVDRSKYNLFTPEFSANPYSVLNQMREEDPIYFFEPLGWWFVMRYDDVSNIFHDWPRFSARRTAELAYSLVPDAEPGMLDGYLRNMDLIAFLSDPPLQASLRKTTNRGFMPTSIALKESSIQNIVNQLLDDVQDKGKMDGVVDFSEPLLSLVMADFLGFPKEDWRTFRGWAAEIARLWGGTPLTIEQAKHSQQCSFDLLAYVAEQINEHRKNPKEDMISYLLVAENEGRVSPETVVSLCAEMLIGGIIDVVGIAILTLRNHPAQLQKLKENPLLWHQAVEEIMRYDTPAIFTHRLVKEDVEIGGQQLKKGQVVFVGLGSSNRDPRVFNEPDRFDITREDNKHLTFACGIHHCMGSALARLEIRIALQTLFERFPKLQIAGDILWKEEGLMFHGPHSIPLTF